MGQRTMLFTVAEDINGQVTVNGYYNQWGNGRTMPLAVISLIINCFRNEKAYWEHYNYPFANTLQFDHEAQRFDQVLSETLPDGDPGSRETWKTPSLIGAVTRQYDNNNGACVLYARQVPDPEDKSGKDYEIEFSLGFLMGWGDSYDDANKGKLRRLGKPFQKWLSLKDWASLKVNRDYTDKGFVTWFTGFLNEFDVKIMGQENKTENETENGKD